MANFNVFSGPPLSGKSAIAGLFAAATGIPVLEMDSVRLRILPESTQSKADRNAAYRSMHFTAERLVLCGVQRVTLVATYRPSEHRKELLDAADRCGASIVVVQFSVKPEVAVARFGARGVGHAAVDLTEQRVRELAAEFPYFEGAPVFNTTNDPPSAILDSVLKYVDSGQVLRDVGGWLQRAM